MIILTLQLRVGPTFDMSGPVSQLHIIATMTIRRVRVPLRGLRRHPPVVGANLPITVLASV